MDNLNKDDKKSSQTLGEYQIEQLDKLAEDLHKFKKKMIQGLIEEFYPLWIGIKMFEDELDELEKKLCELKEAIMKRLTEIFGPLWLAIKVYATYCRDFFDALKKM